MFFKKIRRMILKKAFSASFLMRRLTVIFLLRTDQGRWPIAFTRIIGVLRRKSTSYASRTVRSICWPARLTGWRWIVVIVVFIEITIYEFIAIVFIGGQRLAEHLIVVGQLRSSTDHGPHIG